MLQRAHARPRPPTPTAPCPFPRTLKNPVSLPWARVPSVHSVCTSWGSKRQWPAAACGACTASLPLQAHTCPRALNAAHLNQPHLGVVVAGAINSALAHAPGVRWHLHGAVQQKGADGCTLSWA